MLIFQGTNISHLTGKGKNHRLKSAGLKTGYVIVPWRLIFQADSTVPEVHKNGRGVSAKGRIVWVQNVSNAKIHHLTVTVEVSKGRFSFVRSRVQIDIYMDVEPKIGVFPPKPSILIGFSMK